MEEQSPKTHEITIYVGAGRDAREWSPESLTWNELVKRLSDVTRTHETFNDYQNMPKSKKDAIKDVGGFVGGVLKGGRRRAENVAWRSLITLDFDFAPRLLEQSEIEFAAALYTTHSHAPDKPRFRLVAPLKYNISPDKYPAVARWVAKSIGGLEWVDPTTFEINRLMFWPSASKDGEFIFWEKQGPWIDPEEILAQYDDWTDAAQWPRSSREDKSIKRQAKKQGDPYEKPGVIGAFCRTYDVKTAIEVFLEDVYEPFGEDRYTYKQGSTAGGVVVYDDGKFVYSFHATDPIGGKLVNSFDLVRIHLYGDRDEVAEPGTPVNRLPSYQAMLALASEDEEVKQTIGLEQLGLAKADFKDDMEWLSKLERYPKTGELRITFRNFELILENDPNLKGRFGYDLFANRVAVLKPLPWRQDSGQFENVDDAALRGYIENTYGIRHKERLMDALMTVSRKNSFHPVRDYLNSLDWDGVPRLETVFIDYVGAEDNPHVRKLTKKALVAAVKRIFEPGAKFDEMITLVGPQGIGKSRIIHRLSKGWFTDSLDSLNGKDAYESIQGVWLVEMAEMSAIKRAADVEMVKKFLSKQYDRYRPPYARMIEEYPRQCIFIGSTNTFEFLVDKTGNRRFWPFRCGVTPQRPWEELTEEEVDQIWAEALVYYREGYPTYLKKDEDADTIEWVTGRQQEHTEENSLTGMIQEFLDRPLPDDWDDRDLFSRRAYLEGVEAAPSSGQPRNKVCVMEVWAELLGNDPAKLDRRASREIGAIIESLGWKRNPALRFKNYGRQRAFVRGVSTKGVNKV
ncbi:hypothetical protein H1164_03465 [Thermoactinomyces daqus]|uniref:Virulence-associated protein E-like domain-containing protein n=1 Tax=Thermoactinomyces daqus TaxID=1329516 RepID=A0A7W1X8F7_9BACL|nr:virulence-associated E family protein [Thermoactinomyces daqus]MBA4541961.1 hypothetical protein [Thermoactinomyces daqus]